MQACYDANIFGTTGNVRAAGEDWLSYLGKLIIKGEDECLKMLFQRVFLMYLKGSFNLEVFTLDQIN